MAPRRTNVTEDKQIEGEQTETPPSNVKQLPVKASAGRKDSDRQPSADIEDLLSEHVDAADAIEKEAVDRLWFIQHKIERLQDKVQSSADSAQSRCDDIDRKANEDKARIMEEHVALASSTNKHIEKMLIAAEMLKVQIDKKAELTKPAPSQSQIAAAVAQAEEGAQQ